MAASAASILFFRGEMLRWTHRMWVLIVAGQTNETIAGFRAGLPVCAAGEHLRDIRVAAPAESVLRRRGVGLRGTDLMGITAMAKEAIRSGIIGPARRGMHAPCQFGDNVVMTAIAGSHLLRRRQL